MSDTEQEPEAAAEVDLDHLVADVISMVDDLITNPDRDAIIAGLNAEIDMVQARYTVLSALRDSLIGDTEEESQEPEPELPLAEPEPALDRNSLEARVIRYITDAGPTLPGAVAKAVDVHSTKIGRIVSASSALDKRYITGKGNCIVLKA
jgi:hypothetical protein